MSAIFPNNPEDLLVDGAGSPTTFARRRIFVGSGATGGGSLANIIFTTAFSTSDTPIVIITPGSNALNENFGLAFTTAGSFQVRGETANKNFNWVAFGIP